jgi:hypothetical protein
MLLRSTGTAPRPAAANSSRRGATRQQQRTVAARAGEDGAPKAGGAPALSEDMIARLRAAEEEAARLKKQLADLQTTAAAQVGVLVWRGVPDAGR